MFSLCNVSRLPLRQVHLLCVWRNAILAEHESANVAECGNFGYIAIQRKGISDPLEKAAKFIDASRGRIDKVVKSIASFGNQLDGQ